MKRKRTGDGWMLVFTAAAALLCPASIDRAWAHPVHLSVAASVKMSVKMSVELADGGRLLGWLTSHDHEGFGFRTREGEELTVAWDRLTTAWVVKVHHKVLKDNDARGWFDLASHLSLIHI